MANPERQNLILLLRDKQNRPKEIHVNPLCFSKKALREIVRYQIFRADQVEIAIVNGKTILLKAGEIRKARLLFGDDRRRFLDATAQAMHDAKEIIIRNAG